MWSYEIKRQANLLCINTYDLQALRFSVVVLYEAILQHPGRDSSWQWLPRSTTCSSCQWNTDSTRISVPCYVLRGWEWPQSGVVSRTSSRSACYWSWVKKQPKLLFLYLTFSSHREAKVEFGETVAANLKLSDDGKKVLWPQPTDSPIDPQNWSSRRKSLQLFIITMAAIVPDFDSGIGQGEIMHAWFLHSSSCT